jgi:thymidylate synthase ThyX
VTVDSPSKYQKLTNFVSNTDRDVFALKNLPEEVVAFLFARYSRSALSLRDDLLSMLRDEHLDSLVGSESLSEPSSADDSLLGIQERARAFAEKYVVGYGHGSVAEHAVVKLALENVSILTSKLVEDCRLASYTEKSTRYVEFDSSKAYYPAHIINSSVGSVYKEAVASLMEAYSGWMPLFVEEIKRRTPKTEKQTDRGYTAACKSTACDILRYLLPTATHTNIGVTVNARTLENMITKLLSQPLDEGQRLGEAIKREATPLVPTLLKYADANEYRAERTALSSYSTERGQKHENSARIIGPHLSERDALALIALPWVAGEFGIDNLLAGRGKHDAAPRELERVSLTLDLVMDYGAFRDIQRHRLATQLTQPLNVDYGFERPIMYAKFGYEEKYNELMARAAKAYDILVDAGFAAEAPYVLPLAYRVRTLFTANLREWFHLIELRSSRQGHPSYRRIAMLAADEIERVYPAIARYIRVNRNEYALTRD